MNLHRIDTFDLQLFGNAQINAAAGPYVATDQATRDGVIENVQLVRPDASLIKTYGASATAAAGVSGLFFFLTGNASTIVRVRKILFSGVASTAGFFDLIVAKYSSVATGGTLGTAPIIAPMDSATPNASAASATLSVYTAVPTAGTAVGTIAARKVLLSSSTTLTYAPPQVEFTFGAEGEQCPTLRGTSQQISLTLTSAPTGPSVDWSVWWTEESNSDSF